jgi:hypothetical protein
MPVDAATAAQRYGASSSFAPQRWTEGIQATQKQPGQLAANAIQKYINNVNAAAQSGYTARRMQEGDAKWKPNSLAKAQNYSTGLQQGQSAYQAGYGAFWNYMGPYWQQLQGMPNNTDADAEARVLFWIRNSRNYQKP